MSIMDTLQPYLTSPMYVSMGLTLLILLIFPFLLKFIRPDMWNNFFHIPYWHAYILNDEIVLKRLIIKKDLKQSKVNLIEDKPYSWIIKDNSWINYKAASIVFLDVKSCISINLMTETERELFQEIKEEKDHKKILSKIPIINRFAHSKNLFKPEKLVGFSTKVKSNPEFIINAVTLCIFLKQKFTNDIIKVPKTIWEILEENMTLLIVLSAVCILAFLFLQKVPNL